MTAFESAHTPTMALIASSGWSRPAWEEEEKACITDNKRKGNDHRQSAEGDAESLVENQVECRNCVSRNHDREVARPDCCQQAHSSA